MAGYIEQAVNTLIKGLGPAFPVDAPPKTKLPYNTFQTITNTGATDDLDGPGNIERAIIQVDSRAGTYAGGKDLARSVKDVLNGFRGDVETAGEIVKIRSCLIVSSIDLPETTDSSIIHRVSADYEILFSTA